MSSIPTETLRTTGASPAARTPLRDTWAGAARAIEDAAVGRLVTASPRLGRWVSTSRRRARAVLAGTLGGLLLAAAGAHLHRRASASAALVHASVSRVGVVDRVTARLGDRVGRGAVLARLAAAGWEAHPTVAPLLRRAEQAERRLERARFEWAQRVGDAELTAGRASVRFQALKDGKRTPRRLRRARATLVRAQARAEAARREQAATLAALEAAVAARHGRVLALRATLASLEVRAPAPGVVIAGGASPGQRVAPGEALFSIRVEYR